jgi:hypothetical protein
MGTCPFPSILYIHIITDHKYLFEQSDQCQNSIITDK